MKSNSEIKNTITRTQQARRADIIAAAITVINRDGYAGASVQKIADEALASKSTVLYHFKSRSAIDKAIIGTVFEDGVAYMTSFIMQAQTYQEKLKAYLTSNIQFIANNVEAIAAVHEIERNTSRRHFDDSTPLTQNEAPTHWLATMLSEGQKTKEFGAFDPQLLAAAVRLVIDSSSYYILLHPSLDVSHYIAEIIQLFMRATASSIRKEE